MQKLHRLLAAVLLVLFAPPLLAADGADPAEFAPADSLVFVGISDFDQMWKAYEKTSAYQMTQDPAAKDALKGADMLDKLTDKIKERLSKALDVPAAQLKSPFKGAVAFWASAPKGDEKTPEPGLVAGIGDKELMKKYYDAAMKKLKETSSSYEAVSAGSNSIDFFKNDKDKDKKEDAKDADADEDDSDDDASGHDEDADPISHAIDEGMDELFSAKALPPTLALCLTDERLYVASTPDQIKEVLRREKGADSLATSDDYKQLTRQFKPLGQVRLLVNFPALFEAERKEDPESAKMIDAMGVKGLRSLIAHLHIGGDEYEYKIEALALMSGERSGLCKILSMENHAIAPGKEVPQDSIGYFSMNLSLKDLIDEVERIIRQVSPEMAEQIHTSLEEGTTTPDGDKISPRKDVLEHLRAPLAAYFSASKPYEADSGRFIISIAHKNRAAMEKLLGVIQATTGGMTTAREVRGTQVLDGPPMIGVSMAALSDSLVIGNTAAVENSLGGASDEGLASTAAFKTAAKLVPGEAWGVGFLDNRRLWDAMIGFADKKADLTGNMSAGVGIALALVNMYEAQFKDGKIEDAKKLVKYQSQWIGTFATTPDGVRFTSVQLKAKGEER